MPIRVLDPTQEPEILPATIARRPDDRPVRLGLLSNGKTNAARFLQLLRNELSQHLQIEQVVELAKDSSSTNAPEPLIDRFAEECDLALVAIGD